MNQRRLLSVVAVTVVVAGAVGASVALGVGPAAAMFGEEPQPPALQSFETFGTDCTDDFASNSSTRIAVDGPDTRITYARNVSLADPSQELGDPTFERVNDSAYSLSIPIESTTAEVSDCPASVRYEAAMRIPAGEDPWRLVIRHDGAVETAIWGDADQSLTGGSASAGGSSSA